MKEYLITSYKEHYAEMNRYMLMYDRDAEKKVEYEYGACSVIAKLLTNFGFMSNDEFIDFRNSLPAARLYV